MSGTRVDRAAGLCALVMRYTTCELNLTVQAPNYTTSSHSAIDSINELSINQSITPLSSPTTQTTINHYEQTPQLPAHLTTSPWRPTPIAAHQVSHNCFQGEEKPKKLAASFFLLLDLSTTSSPPDIQWTPRTIPRRNSPSGIYLDSPSIMVEKPQSLRTS